VRAQIPFTLVTPIISNIVGATLTLTSDASAVVLTSFEQVGGEVTFPSSAPSPSQPVGMCKVPDFTLGPTKIRDADDVWTDPAGFNAANLTTIGANGQNIVWQSVPPETM